MAKGPVHYPPSSMPPGSKWGTYRPKRVVVTLTQEEFDCVTQNAIDRQFASKVGLMRWYATEDARGNILHVDRAIRNLCQYLMEGFGGAVAVMAAQMEAANNRRNRE